MLSFSISISCKSKEFIIYFPDYDKIKIYFTSLISIRGVFKRGLGGQDSGGGVCPPLLDL